MVLPTATPFVGAVRAMETSVGAATVKLTVPVAFVPVTAALIVALPADTPVAMPVVLPTVATAGFEEVHTAAAVTSPVVPLA